ncbi:MAG: NINE protein [Elusimicrobia bacterium]|nr:NINE protein [Elusimicrobiota bacterium]
MLADLWQIPLIRWGVYFIIVVQIIFTLCVSFPLYELYITNKRKEKKEMGEHRRYCTRCGTQVQPQAVICLACGCNVEGACNYCFSCGMKLNPEQVVCLKCGVRVKPNHVTASPNLQLGEGRNKLIAVLLALLLGGLGAHKFYLGRPIAGILYLLFCWTLIPSLLALIDLIIYLTMSEREFNATYNSSLS